MYGITAIEFSFIMPHEPGSSLTTHRGNVFVKAKEMALEQNYPCNVYKDGDLWIRVWPDGEVDNFKIETRESLGYDY